MFLRNKQESLNIILRTKLGFKKVAPQEVIEIDEKHLLTGLNSNLEVLKEMPVVTAEPEVPQVPQDTQEQDNKQDGENGAPEQTTEPTKAEEVKPKDETPEGLEAKLVELKKAWTNTSRPKKKESIQKEIKEVQAKLDKLKENN